MPSIFNDVLVKAAKLTTREIESPQPELVEEKTAFVDAGMTTGAGAPPPGGDPAAAMQGGAPPMDPAAAGGAPPPADPAAGAAPGGDPISGKLDQMLAMLNSQPPAAAAGAAPKPAGGGSKKGGGEMQYNIILKLLARMCDALHIPVSLEELLTQEQQIAAFQAQSGAAAPPAAAPPAGGAPAGGSELMGEIAPPSPVSPLSSVTGGGGGAPPAGGDPAGGQKMSEVRVTDYNFGGIAVSPESLRRADTTVVQPAKTATAKRKKQDILSVLRGG